MKINFNQKLKTLEGKPLEDSLSNKVLTLKDVCVDALLAKHGDENPTAIQKIERYQLANSIHSGKKKELTVEEVVLVKELVGSAFNVIVVGQALEMLESN